MPPIPALMVGLIALAIFVAVQNLGTALSDYFVKITGVVQKLPVGGP